MEYRVDLAGATIELAAVNNALRAADPAALADLDPVVDTLRVSTWVDPDALVAVLQRVGLAVDSGQVERVPSVCCGGCSG